MAEPSPNPTTEQLDGPCYDINPQVPAPPGPGVATEPPSPAQTVYPPGGPEPGPSPSSDTKSEVLRLQEEQGRRLKESYYATIMEIAQHLREARLLAAHLPPHRELSLLSTDIERAFYSLQSLWTTMNGSRDFLYRCADEKLSTAYLLAGAPPIYRKIIPDPERPVNGQEPQ